jgi:hypothetical protein
VAQLIIPDVNQQRFMSVFHIILSTKFIIAIGVYAITIVLGLLCFNKIHSSLDHSILQWPWDNIGMPLFRAALMLVFILLAYPLIFAIADAPSLQTLLDTDERRVNYLVNLLFLITLLFPLVPVLGKWEELILPTQAIAASATLFSWLAAHQGITDIQYWPGLNTALYILVLAFVTHWLAVIAFQYLGEAIDEKFNVTNAGQLLSRALVLFMQSPAILIYCAALGRQLN